MGQHGLGLVQLTQHAPARGSRQPCPRGPLAESSLDDVDRSLRLLDHGGGGLEPLDEIAPGRVTERDVARQPGHTRARTPHLPLSLLGDVSMSGGHPLPGRLTHLGVGPGGSDRLDLPPHLSESSLEPRVGHVPMAMGDEPPNEALVLLQRVGQSNDLLHEARRVRNRHHDRPMATFDLFRQRDFFFARQERNPAHLSEIHSHDVAGGVAPARGQVEFVRVLDRSTVACPVSLKRLRVDVDAGVLTLAEQVVHHRRRRDLWRQDRVDFLAEEVSFLLSDDDELADGLGLLTRRYRRPVYS